MKLTSTPAVPPLQSVWVSANSLATRLETTPSTIWRWSKAGRIPAPTKLAPGTTRWNLDEVLAALAAAAEAETGTMPPSLTKAHEALALKQGEAAPQDSLAAAMMAPTTEGGQQ